jgi:hypothetical protein
MYKIIMGSWGHRPRHLLGLWARAHVRTACAFSGSSNKPINLNKVTHYADPTRFGIIAQNKKQDLGSTCHNLRT